MRLRLGLIRDNTPPDKHSTEEGATEARSSSRHETNEKGTEKRTEATSDAEKERQSTERTDSKDRKTPHKTKDSKDARSRSVRIRPLSEAKAIDTGANFISETFLFLVGGGLILFESWRSRRKENIRREDVAERLEKLEALDNARDVAHEKAIDALQREIERLKANDTKSGGQIECDNSREKTAPSQAVENVPGELSPSVLESGGVRRSSSSTSHNESVQTCEDTTDMTTTRRPTTRS
ncbi:MAG: hypothetical protein M1836_004084 [Candelina mexicana]|nr:MAG: hypothetical protein M1836_004084 [Candelina mexicana]